MKTLCLALLCLAACGRETGTFAVSVAAAPESDLLGRIELLRATLSDPHEVVEARRDADGLSLALETEASGRSGELVLEGFDAAGERIAVGKSGPLPIAALDAALTIYLAPPMSFAEAPVRLATPRSELGAAAFSFGAFLAGGRGPDGTPVDDVEIYDLFQHELSTVEPMPMPLSRPSIVGSSHGTSALLFGGENVRDEPVADAYLFSTAVPPSGGYVAIPVSDAYARAGASIATAGDLLFVAGTPALLLDVDRREVTEAADGAAADGVAVSVWPDVFVVGAGVEPDGAVVYTEGGFEPVRFAFVGDRQRRVGHVGVEVNGRALILGGAIDDELERSALIYAGPPGRVELVEDFLAFARTDPAVAVTEDHIVVAGGTGTNGDPVGAAEIFDAVTLERVAVLDLVVPRTGAVAVDLGNGQVLLAGGVGPDGAPTDVVELFTPYVAPE